MPCIGVVKFTMHFSLKPENEMEKWTVMNLNDVQRQRVTAWILQGAKLSEIQNASTQLMSIRDAIGKEVDR